MPDLFMPGAIRIESPRRNPLNDNGFRLLTWHTMECPYSWTVEQALRFLIQQGSEAFVFHPITGQWGQCQPMDTGARTLKAPGGIATNRFGSVHQQVEVIGYANKPWTSDLTPEGKAGLARGLDFFRSWGIPDQWAFDTPPPAYPGPGVKRGYPSRSGHAYHAGWIGNDHGDPGAIAAPWTLVAGSPKPDPQIKALQQELAAIGLLAPTDVDGIDGPKTQAAKEAYVTLQEQIDRLARDAAQERSRAQARQALTNARTGALIALAARIAERVDVAAADILAAIDTLTPGPDDLPETEPTEAGQR